MVQNTFKKPVIIFQPKAIGDILFVQKIAHHYTSQGRKVIFPIMKENEWIRNGIERPEMLEMPLLEKEEFLFNDQFMALGMIQAMSPMETADYTFLSLYFCWKYDPMRVMQLKYDIANLNAYDWASYVKLRRDRAKEERLFAELGLNDGQPYALVNEHCSNRHIPFPGSTPEKMVQLANMPGYTLFDWATVIERAARIVTVDTSLVLLVEILQAGGKPLHLVSRYDPPSMRPLDGLLRQNWRYYDYASDLRYD